MKTIQILELYSQGELLRVIGAFEEEETVEKYKLKYKVDPSKYYQINKIQLIETI